MITSVLSSMPFKAPADPDNTAHRRAILEILRAADNDNPAPPRLDADDDRKVLMQPEFAPRLIWKWLREVAEGNGGGSNWYAVAPDFDEAAPAEPESSVERLWPVETLICAAHDGVDYCDRGGRIVPYGARRGALEYSETTGRMIQVGKLMLADDLRTDAANDDAPQDEPEDKSDQVEIIGGVRRPKSDIDKRDADDGPEPLGIDEAIAAISGEPVRRRGSNVSSDERYNAKIARAGSITGIRHRTRSGKVVTLTRPRNLNGAYRDRGTEPPPPIQRATAEDAIDARQRLQRLVSVLSERAVQVLAFSIDAPNFQSIGEMLGKSGDYAKRFGRQELVKACAELEEALQSLKYKYAA